jgi:hypothetical protein
MSDIFISYAREDRTVAESLAAAFARHGWTVWWDRKIQIGRSFSETIERELDAARCVVVLWSKASVTSSWVMGEAAEGARRGVLVPLSLGDARLPLEFRRLQTATIDPELIENSVEFSECIATIDALLSESTRTTEEQGSETVRLDKLPAKSIPPATQVTFPEKVSALSLPTAAGKRSRYIAMATLALAIASSAAYWWRQKESPPGQTIPKGNLQQVTSAPAGPTSTMASADTATTSGTSTISPALNPLLQRLIGTWDGDRHGEGAETKTTLHIGTSEFPAQLGGTINSESSDGSRAITELTCVLVEDRVWVQLNKLQLFNSSGDSYQGGLVYLKDKYWVYWGDNDQIEFRTQSNATRYTFYNKTTK